VFSKLFESFQGNDYFGEGEQFGKLSGEARFGAPKLGITDFINLQRYGKSFKRIESMA
jgi:hypothetical protein